MDKLILRIEKIEKQLSWFHERLQDIEQNYVTSSQINEFEDKLQQLKEDLEDLELS